MPNGDPSTLIRVADLPKAREKRFALRPGADALKTLADALEVSDVRKVVFEGTLSPAGRDDWRLEARLGATVVQPCVVTLAPVTTRIEESVTRLFLADPPPVPEGGEVEMPEDETVESLPGVIDLGAILAESLALALPDYPRAEGAALGDTQVTEPGKTPMTDDDAKPFAGLAAIRDSLKKNGG